MNNRRRITILGQPMLILIGLIIVAVLLFGSSAVLGALGTVLGLLASSAALTYGAFLIVENTGLTSKEALYALVACLLVIVAVAKILLDRTRR